MLHGHCHHKAILKMGDEESVLKKMRADLQTLDSGCCGMAGPFGIDAHKYDVSVAICERVLPPAVRQADAETIIVSDGFSCREQISLSLGAQASAAHRCLRRRAFLTLHKGLTPGDVRGAITGLPIHAALSRRW
jgi:Fe-S oxidoreductase